MIWVLLPNNDCSLSLTNWLLNQLVFLFSPQQKGNRNFLVFRRSVNLRPFQYIFHAAMEWPTQATSARPRSQGLSFLGRKNREPLGRRLNHALLLAHQRNWEHSLRSQISEPWVGPKRIRSRRVYRIIYCCRKAAFIFLKPSTNFGSTVRPTVRIKKQSIRNPVIWPV